MNKYKVWHIDAYSGWYDYDNHNDCNIHTDIVMDACFTANQVSSMFASQLGGRTVVIAKCECIGQGECEVPSSTEKEMEEMGKFLSYILRHSKKEFADGLINEKGWMDVDILVDKYGFTHKLLEELVSTNEKQRYEFNSDHRQIRARQGHSIPVDVELKETVPPDVLYHGTAWKYMSSIKQRGLLKKTRLYVHLSADEETAKKVGARHGEPVVIHIDAKKMYEDGIKFYLSNNGVWLTDHVNPKYFIGIESVNTVYEE